MSEGKENRKVMLASCGELVKLRGCAMVCEARKCRRFGSPDRDQVTRWPGCRSRGADPAGPVWFAPRPPAIFKPPTTSARAAPEDDSGLGLVCGGLITSGVDCVDDQHRRGRGGHGAGSQQDHHDCRPDPSDVDPSDVDLASGAGKRLSVHQSGNPVAIGRLAREIGI